MRSVTEWVASVQSSNRRWTLWTGVGLIWGTSFCVGVLSAIVNGERAPWMMDVLFVRPLLILTAVVGAALVISHIARIRVEIVWSMWIRILPIAGALTFIAAILREWNDGSGRFAMLPLEAIGYVASLGLWPFMRGPDVIVRFMLATSFVCVALLLRSSLDRMRWIVAIFLGWVVIAFTELIPSWIAYAATWIFHLGFPSVPGDLDRALARLHLSSYWTNFQADRFLVGVGDQLTINTRFSFLAVTLLVMIGWMIWLTMRVQPWSRPMVRLAIWKKYWNMSLLYEAVPWLMGIFAARGIFQLRFTIIDTLAFFLLFASLIGWIVYRRLQEDVDHLTQDLLERPTDPLPSGLISSNDAREILGILLGWLAVASFVLGWSVLLLMSVLLLVGWVSSPAMFGWERHPVGRLLIRGIVTMVLFLIGAAFVARTPYWPSGLLRFAVAWGCLAIAMEWLRQHPAIRRDWRSTGLWVAAAGACVFLAILRANILISLLGLLGVFWWWLCGFSERWRRFAPLSLLGYGVIGTLLLGSL